MGVVGDPVVNEMRRLSVTEVEWGHHHRNRVTVEILLISAGMPGMDACILPSIQQLRLARCSVSMIRSKSPPSGIREEDIHKVRRYLIDYGLGASKV